MKNLENYGVQEMNTQEIRKTDGGYDTPWYYWINPGFALGYICGSYIEGKYEQGAACN